MSERERERGERKLQALVYDSLPSPTAVFSYATGSEKLSANEQFFCWRSNSSKFVTNNSNYQTFVLQLTMLLTPAQIKPKSFESRQNSFFFFFFFFNQGWMCLVFTCVLGR